MLKPKKLTRGGKVGIREEVDNLPYCNFEGYKLCKCCGQRVDDQIQDTFVRKRDVLSILDKWELVADFVVGEVIIDETFLCCVEQAILDSRLAMLGDTIAIYRRRK